MKWEYEAAEQKTLRLAQWHSWFTWHPVWYKGKAAWLRTVDRRLVILNSFYASEKTQIYWEYDIY